MRRYTVEVQGRDHVWGFTFEGNPDHLKDWLADGVKVYRLVNTVPDWMPAWLVKPWCAVERLLRFCG